MLLHPQPLELKRQDGRVVTFMLSKFPATAGREIVATYPVANMPKLGDYKVSEAVMLKLMSHVAVVIDGNQLPLVTRELVDNHAGDWETLARLEWAMMEYNCSFFGNGTTSISFGDIVQKLKPWISQILTGLSAQSSAPEKPL